MTSENATVAGREGRSTTTGPDLGLTDKVALVVGTGGGIGQAAVRYLAEAGADIACFDVSAEAAERAATQARELGVKAIALTGDVTRREDVDQAVSRTVKELGGLDAVIDVVGVTSPNPALDVTDDDWNTTLSTVLLQSMKVAQAAARAMIEQGTGGSITFVASIGGMTGITMQAAYGASKAGLIGLAKTLALEWGEHGIRVNTVAPGAVETPVLLERTTEAQRVRYGKSVPLHRIGRPEDIAGACLFLSSGLAGYVTGQNLAADGGAMAKWPIPASWSEDKD